MNIKICNPKEDQYGNSKENIFLAFNDKGGYLGSAYAYPALNYHQVHEIPYLIFIDVNAADNVDKVLGDEVRQKLFNKVFIRAKELRMQRPELKTRVYAGFESDRDKLDFYINNGFDQSYSIIMETDIPKDFTYTLPESIRVSEVQLYCEQELLNYKSIYDEIFLTPLDLENLTEQQKRAHFKNLSFLVDGQLAGGCTIFEKDGFGYIETVFILLEKRGKGLSKDIVGYIFNYFLSKGLNKTRLEVWDINKRAVELYKSFGYSEVGKSVMFPGVTL